MPATRHENKRVTRLEIARVAFGANPALDYCHTGLKNRTTNRCGRSLGDRGPSEVNRA